MIFHLAKGVCWEQALWAVHGSVYLIGAEGLGPSWCSVCEREGGGAREQIRSCVSVFFRYFSLLWLLIHNCHLHKHMLKCCVNFASGITSENVAARFGVTREEQDELAARSHARAAAAQASGRFNDEIVPVHTIWKDPKTEEEKEIVVDKDDGIRAGVTVANLAKLKPAFQRGGTTTAGNSSQVGLAPVPVRFCGALRFVKSPPARAVACGGASLPQVVRRDGTSYGMVLDL